MRYIEVRMEKIIVELLEDIDKDIIDWRKNFDDFLDELIVLFVKLLNLLLNGVIGIVVGMVINIFFYNLGELVDGILVIIDNKDIEILEFMNYIKGLDFLIGVIIDGRVGIIDVYKIGRGKIKVRGKVDIEELKNGKLNIIVSEILY